MWPEDVSVEYFKRKIFSIPCKITWLPEIKFLLTGKQVEDRMKKKKRRQTCCTIVQSIFIQMFMPHYNLRP